MIGRATTQHQYKGGREHLRVSTGHLRAELPAHIPVPAMRRSASPPVCACLLEQSQRVEKHAAEELEHCWRCMRFMKTTRAPLRSVSDCSLSAHQEEAHSHAVSIHVLRLSRRPSDTQRHARESRLSFDDPGETPRRTCLYLSAKRESRLSRVASQESRGNAHSYVVRWMANQRHKPRQHAGAACAGTWRTMPDS